MSDFVRYQCWHTERITQVINKEAISVELADFMATHAPLAQIAHLQPSGAVTISEAHLLADLQRAAQQDQHMFAVVEGEPGVGKSHLIRWLHERYLADNAQGDQVLLIARAQNSLLGTLRQIIERLDVVGESLRQQIEKLRGAADSLSERALQDSLINHLAIATYEREPSSKAKIKRNIERFLLDPVVRETLKAQDGPIERISRFLTSGRRADDQSQRPEFVAEDFDLRTETLREIRSQGYAEARELADALVIKEDLRQDLAIYLNSLLDYAISRTVVLSPDDLKQTFNDLRRELRRQGKSLALFVEDITAFTGVDVGLIDVLATQHTGEGNRDFCRILSVVGITDSYYRDRFPKNLQERITYHLSLNQGEVQQTANLLSNEQTVGDLVGRYLNAMRVEHSTIQSWYSTGGRIEQIPNPCETCQFREKCHAAFGAVDIGSSGHAIEVGLYPFNRRAIWNIFRRLDHVTISKTPRSLLNYVVLDVLQTHGSKVATGTFPPPAKDLAAGVRDIPALVKPVQQRIINEQGGQDAARLQTLVLYWGDGTIDTRNEGVKPTVSDLKHEVFRAFSLPIPVVTGELPDDNKPIDPPLPPPPPPPPPVGTPFDQDIANWRAGGPLEYYEKLRDLLVDFIQGAIPWELHGIPDLFVTERIRGRRFKIDGQVGLVRGDYLTFARSDELADVLQALAELNQRGYESEPSTLGAHLATLSAWLAKVETEIVEFARKPSSSQDAPMRIVELLLLDCLLIEWLCDGLKTDASTQEMFLSVLESAARETGDRALKEADWKGILERATAVHSPAWVQSLRQIGLPRVKSVRRNLARLLNLPQGNSSDVRYVDAVTALQIISAMMKRDWELPSIEQIDTNAETIWTDGGTVYQTLEQRITTIMDEERQFLQQKIGRLTILGGDATPEEIIRSVEQLLPMLTTYNKPHSIEAPPLKAAGFKNTVQHLSTTIQERGRATSGLRMSGGARYVEQFDGMLNYLEKVDKTVARLLEQSERQIAQYSADSQALALEEQTRQLYDETLAVLREAGYEVSEVQS